MEQVSIFALMAKEDVNYGLAWEALVAVECTVRTLNRRKCLLLDCRAEPSKTGKNSYGS